jgi:hypothetical protein
MIPALLVLAVFGGVAVYFYRRSASSPVVSTAPPDGTVGVATTVTAPSGVHPEFDAAIAQAASVAGISPVTLKAIAATETYFNPDAINPEQDFTLNGVSYSQYDRTGQALLVAWIKAGNDPVSIGLNPSVGIAQVRVSEGKAFIQGLNAWDLFDAATCFEAAAYFISQLIDGGVNDSTLDAYNVGLGANWRRGIRNLPYRDKANGFQAKFAGDFPGGQ